MVDTKAEFTINAVEAGLFDKGKLRVTVASASNSAAVAVKDNENGLYTVMYTATSPERYSVAVQYNQLHLPGSPFPVMVLAKPNAHKCHASGACLEPGAVVRTGEVVEFSVETGQAGDGQLGVRAAGANGETLRAFTSDEGDGLYSVRLDAPQTSGTYMLHCCWSGVHIPGSPFKMNVVDNLGMNMVSVSGQGLREAFVMQQATVSVFAQRPGLFESRELCATAVGPDGHTSVAVADRGDGNYRVTYMPPSVGEYHISVLLRDEDIPGSPFIVQVYLPPMADRCHAHGPCLEGEANIGKPAEFFVNTRDAGHGVLTINAKDPDGGTVRTFLSDDGETSKAVRMDPSKVGQYTIEVLWSGNHVPGSPFAVNVGDAVEGSAVIATGNGLSRAFSMMPAAFTISAPDSGLFEKGVLTVNIENAMQGRRAEFDVRDLGDGNYTVNYMAPSTGAFIASIKYRKQHIAASPFKITVFPRPRPENCVASGGCLTPKSVNLSGKPLQFTVTTKNAGYGRLTVKAVGPDGGTARAYVADEEKTRHVVQVETRAPGAYLINVKWGTIPIPGSPFKVRVYPPPNAGVVVAEGPGLMNGLPVGRPTHFVIKTHGAGIGELRVRMHGVKGGFQIAVDKDEHDSRLLHASYTPTLPGTYEVSVLWSGQHVPNSPFRLTIGEIEPPRSSAAPVRRHSGRKVISRRLVPMQDNYAMQGAHDDGDDERGGVRRVQLWSHRRPLPRSPAVTR